MRSMLTRTLLAALAVCAVTAIGASAASAAIKYEWMVNKTALASGKTDGISAKVPSGKKFVLKVKLFGTLVELNAAKMKFNGGEIAGGKPGTGQQTVTLEEVTVVNPKGCTAAAITTEDLHSTIVEGATSGAGNGKALTLLKPSGEGMFTLSLGNKALQG